MTGLLLIPRQEQQGWAQKVKKAQIGTKFCVTFNVDIPHDHSRIFKARSSRKDEQFISGQV